MFELLRQFAKFFRVYRKFWLMPIVVLMLGMGILLVVVQGSGIAPFIYALF